MSKLDDALKRFEQVGNFGMRESDYIQVGDSLAWFREDLAVVKKSVKLLGLYKTLSNLLFEGDYGSLIKTGEIQKTIDKLEKELEDKQ